MNTNNTNKIPWWVLAACLVVTFAGITDRDLWTPDEPRDAAMSLEMSRTGQIIIPHLAGLPFVEKPPMYFAVAGFFARTLGPIFGNTGAIRLASAFFAVGVLLMTFLTARRLFDRSVAMISVAVLASMGGFIMNMHWIRVDAALAFFLAASTWSFVEIYSGNRRHIIPAALFCGGAFLSKGIAGPLFMALGIAALALGKTAEETNRTPGQNGILSFIRALIKNLFFPGFMTFLAVFLLIAGGWMLSFRFAGGEDLWHEWFWQNHFGRALGTATELGHIRSGDYAYYLEIFALYTLPWLPVLIAGIAGSIRQYSRTKSLPSAHIFLLGWAFLSLLMLTCSATKRDIYFLPVMPILAMISAAAFTTEIPRWCRAILTGWLWICVLLLILLATTPLYLPALPRKTPPEMLVFLGKFTDRHLFSAGLAVIAALLILRRRIFPGLPALVTTVSALAFIGIFAVAGKAADTAKSFGPSIRSFAADVPLSRRPMIAGWNFDETTRAFLYYYCDWTVPLVADRKRLLDVVAGRDGKFDSVIITREPSIPGLLQMPYRTIKKVSPGPPSHKRELEWVEKAGRDEEQDRK